MPISVGFGISTPNHVKEVSKFADGVVVGSAIVKVIGENKGKDIAGNIGRFVYELKTATRGS